MALKQPFNSTTKNSRPFYPANFGLSVPRVSNVTRSKIYLLLDPTQKASTTPRFRRMRNLCKVVPASCLVGLALHMLDMVKSHTLGRDVRAVLLLRHLRHLCLKAIDQAVNKVQMV